MEDYEAQEIEFWAKLEEEGMSRSSMLRRSAAAAFGLTIVGSASTAFAANKASHRGTDAHDEGRAQGSRGGGEEGRPPEHDRPPARLGELQGGAPQLPAQVRDRDHERQPGRQLRPGERGDSLAQGRQARSGRRRRRHLVRDLRRQRRACTRSTSTRTTRRSRGRSRTRAASGWATTGVPSRSATTRRSSRTPRRRSRT